MTLSNQKKGYQTRFIAVEILKDVLVKKARLELCLENHKKFDRLPQGEKKRCYAIIKESLRHYGHAEYILSKYIKNNNKLAKQIEAM